MATPRRPTGTTMRYLVSRRDPIAPVWSAVPAPSFTQGIPAAYSLTSICADTGGQALTFSSVGTALPTGVTIDNGAGTLAYDGIGGGTSISGARIRATSVNGTSDSAIFGLTIVGVSPLWDITIPTQNLVTGTAYSLDLDTVCDPDTSTYSVVGGALPAGLTLAGSIISGTPTAATTVDVTIRADDTGGVSSAQSDWIARSTGAGVVWFNGFESDAEVNAYRWAGSFGGGNDPNASTADAGYMTRLPTSGPAGLPCLQILRPANRESNVNWWRPFSAMAAGGNGKAASDPGGGKPIRTWSPTSGGSQTAQWNVDYWGPQTYQQEFYLQMRVQRDPRRVTTAANAVTSVGKQLYLTICSNSLTSQEVVTYSGSGSSGSAGDFFRMYVSGSPPIEQQDPLGRPGQQIGGELSTYPSNYCDVGSNPGRCWSFSGGWDTLLYHVTPGTFTSGSGLSTIRVYAARQGVTTYTKIYDTQFSHQWQTASTKGWQALLLSTYNNNATFPTEFWHRYAQVIFSTQFIPCPQF